MTQNKLEVGQQIIVDGRAYWVSRIMGDNVELMPDPDDPLGRNKATSFWPTFLVIILMIVTIRLVF